METIKLSGLKKPLSISQIMYVVADGNYSYVYTANGKRILSSMTLKAIEEQSSELIRIHKGALVNWNFIQGSIFTQLIKQYTCMPITMRDGKTLTISRRRWGRCRLRLRKLQTVE